MDILGTKKEALSVFDHMGHIVVRAVSPVSDIDVFCAWGDRMPVNNGAEGAEFIFVMDGLEEGVGIDAFFQVIKGIEAETCNSLLRDGLHKPDTGAWKGRAC